MSWPPADFPASDGRRGREPEVGDHTISLPATDGTNSAMVSFIGVMFAAPAAEEKDAFSRHIR